VTQLITMAGMPGADVSISLAFNELRTLGRQTEAGPEERLSPTLPPSAGPVNLWFSVFGI
jgi:hypothetical protein